MMHSLAIASSFYHVRREAAVYLLMNATSKSRLSKRPFAFLKHRISDKKANRN